MCHRWCGETRWQADPQYFQSRVDIQQDEDLFNNYPNIYYVCQQRPQPEEPVLETSAGRCTNPDILNESACLRAGFEFIPTERVAELTFEKNLLEYSCLEEGKEESPAFDRHCSDPLIFSKEQCEDSGGNWSYICFDQDDFSEGGTENEFLLIRQDVWRRCGCGVDPLPLTLENNHLPKLSPWGREKSRRRYH